jgi:hypothetical protein
MLRAIIETRKQNSCFRGHNCFFVVVSCKLPDSFDGIIPHYSDELYSIRNVASQQMDTTITAYVTIAYACKNLTLQ